MIGHKRGFPGGEIKNDSQRTKARSSNAIPVAPSCTAVSSLLFQGCMACSRKQECNIMKIKGAHA